MSDPEEDQPANRPPKVHVQTGRIRPISDRSPHHGMQLFEYLDKRPNELELFAEGCAVFPCPPAPRWQKPMTSQVSAPWRTLEGARDSFCPWRLVPFKLHIL
jgi:hypothetical protein